MNHDTTAQRRVQRVRFEPRRRTLYVAQAERMSANFIRVTLTGAELEGFQSPGFDDHVKLGVPDAGGEWVLRDFTPRAFDAARRELVIEFALHAHGPASDWARQARPGQSVMVGGPRGSMVIPTDYGWHLLAGDASALPAIARRLEELPAGARARVLVHVDDAADRRSFHTAAHVDLQWASSAGEWLAALRELELPPGEGFAWCAGEAQAMKQAREVLTAHHRQPRDAMKVAAYWKAGVASFKEQPDA